LCKKIFLVSIIFLMPAKTMTKTIRLGIVGAENSHSFKIAQVCNQLKKVPMRVTHLWGETRESAESSAKKGAIPKIVSDWKRLAGEVDGVMIDHRHGAMHAPVATYFIERGIPTFIDKPMTCNLQEAKSLFSLAEKHGAPLMTFSAKPLQLPLRRLLGKVRGEEEIVALNSTGSCNLESKYGGVFFYGIHQVDCVIEAMGVEAEYVTLRKFGNHGMASIEFEGGRIATLNLLAMDVPMVWQFCTDKGVHHFRDKIGPHVYVEGSKLINAFVRSGTAPFDRRRMLAPIAILEALQKACDTGRRVKVSKF